VEAEDFSHTKSKWVAPQVSAYRFTVTVTFTRFAVGFKLDKERASPVEIGVRNAIGSVGIVGSCCTPSR
jgi:hypothetical protein